MSTWRRSDGTVVPRRGNPRRRIPNALHPARPASESVVLASDDGAKSAFYALVAASRPPRSAPVVRFEWLSQHDFGHVDVRYVDGRKERVHFFASRLKCSRFVAVSLVKNERVETLVRSLVDHFVSFGGVPLLAVFDRPRTVVQRSPSGAMLSASTLRSPK